MKRSSHGPGLRLGLAGNAGTGKTTLGRALAGTLDVPLLGDVMREALTAGLDLHRLDRGQHRALLADLARQRIALGAEIDGFVADGTPLDHLAQWLANGYAVDDPEGFAGLLERASTALADWDLVVVLPWGVLPLDADGIRYANPWHQLHVQTVIEGIAERFLPAGRVLRMPREIRTLEDRRVLILERLGRF